jgi:hypothetical protein
MDYHSGSNAGNGGWILMPRVQLGLERLVQVLYVTVEYII